jgi:hypothetical protein
MFSRLVSSGGATGTNGAGGSGSGVLNSKWTVTGEEAAVPVYPVQSGST